MKRRGMVTDSKSAVLLRRFDEGWRPFWERVEVLDADTLRSTPAGSAWSLGLILAHCARWEDWNYKTIADHVRDGAMPSMAGLKEWNDVWAAEDRDITPEDARRWLGEAHGRLRECLDGLEPHQWDELVTQCVEACTFHHYGEHIDSLPAQSKPGFRTKRQPRTPISSA